MESESGETGGCCGCLFVIDDLCLYDGFGQPVLTFFLSDRSQVRSAQEKQGMKNVRARRETPS